MDPSQSLSRRMADVARDLQDETGEVNTLDLAVKLAVDIVEGAEEAAISLVGQGSRRVVTTAAWTSERCVEVDGIQYELGGGPVLSTIWDEEVITCSDVAADRRWGQWGPRTSEATGFASMICFRMFTRGIRRLGALSVYSSQPHAFDGADLDSGTSFAAHAAIALEVTRGDENKDIAMDSRTLIGQATGIVMGAYDIDAIRAFAVLRRLSSYGNIRIHEIAAEVVRTRHVPS